MELRLRLLLSALVTAGVTGVVAAPPACAALPALERLAARGADVSATIVDVTDGRTVEAHAAARRLTPASLTKIVAAAAVLEQWTPDQTFATRLLAGSDLDADGTLRGDLVLRGGGDASLDGEKLWSLALQARARGLRAVTGRLVVSPGPFGTLPCETRDRCDGQAQTDRSYNALLSGVGVDYGNWCVLVRPEGDGAPAGLESCMGVALPIPVDGRITTGPAGGRPTYTVERLSGPGGDRLRVRGSIPAGPVQRVYRAMSDPTLATGLLLRAMLRDLGIGVGDGVTAAPAGEPLAPTLRLLGEVESLPLREQVARMMRYSNNYMADVLTLDLAAARDGWAPQRLSDASRRLVDLLPPSPSDAAPPVITSGSGLTPENRLSARDLTGVLVRMWRDTRRFPAFYGSLVVPRDAPFPGLRRGDAAWLDRVALKTGTLTEPVSVTGIAGYLRRRDGGFLAFAILVNGTTARPRIPAAEALDAARADLLAVLARE